MPVIAPSETLTAEEYARLEELIMDSWWVTSPESVLDESLKALAHKALNAVRHHAPYKPPARKAPTKP